MDYLQKYTTQFRNRFFSLLLLNNLVLLADWYIAEKIIELAGWQLLLALAAAPVLSLSILPVLGTKLLTSPTKLIAQAIIHLSPSGTATPAPDVRHVRGMGKELITSLVNTLYQLVSVVGSVEQAGGRYAGSTAVAATLSQMHDQARLLANALPLPMIILNAEDIVVFVNEAANRYFKRADDDVVGKNFYTVFDMSFPSDDNFAGWLTGVKGKSVNASQHWERVRIGLPGQNDSLQFDLAAHYNQGNSAGYETLLVLYDHTEIYSQDDQAMSFVALSVHELRTPLTLLRGYIEVFDEELGPNLDSEMRDFMQKMNASAQQLAAFVDNILNVAKIEDNQLTLQLHEEAWPDVIDMVVRDLSLRASVRGITIKTDIATDLPAAGVDRYSIYEVLANLIDNAIKYSKGTSEVYVTSRLDDNGMIETSVKDFGLGIDASILPHIFDKFYRNHRNRAQIGGTGLGLFLSKTIVDAHGGQIWVNSKVNEGSTFTFTIQPFSAVEQSGSGTPGEGISRGAHGWIKNHSLYRG